MVPPPASAARPPASPPSQALRMLGLGLLGLALVGAVLLARGLVRDRDAALEGARAARAAREASEARAASARLEALAAAAVEREAKEEARRALARCVLAGEARARAQGACRLAEAAVSTLLLESRATLAPLGRHAALERLAQAALEQSESPEGEPLDPACLSPAALEVRGQALTLLAETVLAQDRPEEAEAPLRDALEILRARAQAEPEVLARRAALAEAQRLLARACAARGQRAEAVEAQQEALTVLRSLSDAEPTSGAWLLALGEALSEMSSRQAEAGRLPEARAHAAEGLRLLSALSRAEPGAGQAHAEALALGRLADLEVGAGEVEAGLVDFERAILRLLPLSDAPEAAPALRADLVDLRRREAQALLRLGRPAPAVDSLREALSVAVGLASRDAERVDMQVRLARVCQELCAALEQNAEHEDALVGRHECVAVWMRVSALEPRRADRRHEVVHAYLDLGDLQEREGLAEPALQSFRLGIEQARALGATARHHAEYGSDLALLHDRASSVLLGLGRRAEALETLRSALLAIEPLAKATPENAFWQADLARIWWRLGDLLIRSEVDRPDGIRALRRAQRLLAEMDRTAKTPAHAGEWLAAVRATLEAQGGEGEQG